MNLFRTSGHAVIGSQFRACCWAILLLIGGYGCGAAHSGEKPAGFKALCVGLQYPDAEKSLKYAASDIRAVAKALADNCGVMPKFRRIEVLVDNDPESPKPVKGEILRRLRAMADEAGPNDKLVFCFSGFGIEADGDAFLLCAGMGEKDESSRLSLAEIAKVLSSGAAKSKFAVIDAGHGFEASESLKGVSAEGVAKAFADSDVAWMTSCDADENSHEDDESKHGLFARYFIEAMRSGATLADADSDGILAFGEIYMHVSNGVGAFLRQNGEVAAWSGRKQSPKAGLGDRIVSNAEEFDRFAFVSASGGFPERERPLPALSESSATPERPVESASDDAATLIRMGDFYSDQGGATLDYAEALRWYRRAADQNSADAQYKIGFMYRGGLGVDQDFAEAAKWYRHAAEQGHADG